MKEERNPFPAYKVVWQEGHGEYEEKKSHFIASVAPASTEQEAAAFIEAVKKKHYDARHNCHAFIIGRNKELTRCSDDGEPAGTAGKPMLEVLLKAEVTDVVAVVTRYFGGTLLGTGGLVRAYTQAVQKGLENAGIALMQYKEEMTLMLEYTEVGKVQHLLGAKGIQILRSDYTDKVEFDIRIPKEQEEAVEKALIEATAGRVTVKKKGARYDMDKQFVDKGDSMG